MTFEELSLFLEQPKKIFITTHRKPDGDAMGSTLALYHLFSNLGHQVKVISPTDYPNFLEYLLGIETVLDFQKSEKICLEWLHSSDLIICTDFNALQRIESLGDHIKNSPLPKVMIDHHLLPEPYADLELWNPKAASSCELVYQFFTLLHLEQFINRDIATCLYTGIITDTGSFRFPSVSGYVHFVVQKLFETGFDHTIVHAFIYDTMTVERVQFYGFCMSERMEYYPEHKTILVWANKRDLENYRITTGDTEGLVNLPMSIHNVNMVCLIMDRPDMVKLSMRSKGDFAVNEICAKYFKGGGHKNAAGGSWEGSIDAAVKLFKDILPLYSPELNSF